MVAYGLFYFGSTILIIVFVHSTVTTKNQCDQFSCTNRLLEKFISVKETIDEMEQKMLRINEPNSNFSKTVEGLLTDMTNLNETVQDQRVEIATLRAENQQLDNTVHNLQLVMGNNSNEIVQLQEEISYLQQSLNDQTSYLQQLVNEQNANFSKTVEGLVADMKDLNKTEQDQSLEVAGLRTEYQQLENTMYNLQMVTGNNSNGIVQLLENGAKLEQGNRNLTRDISSFMDQVHLKEQNEKNTELAFTVSLNDDFTFSNTNERLMFDKVITDVKGAYNLSNGEFRASVHGLYYFSLTIRGINRAHAEIRRNNVIIGLALANSISTWTDTVSTSVAVELYPEDAVFVIGVHVGDFFQNFATYFTGHLLFKF